MINTPAHKPIDAERHADIVAEVLRYPSRAWSALYAPGDYEYDHRDQVTGAGLDLQCADLRLAFGNATDWKTMMFTLRRLINLDNRRRKMSVGVRYSGRVLYGEAL